MAAIVQKRLATVLPPTLAARLKRIAEQRSPVDVDTNQYVHLAGVVFRDDADALSRRLLGVQDPGTNPAETALGSQKV